MVSWIELRQMQKERLGKDHDAIKAVRQCLDNGVWHNRFVP